MATLVNSNIGNTPVALTWNDPNGGCSTLCIAVPANRDSGQGATATNMDILVQIPALSADWMRQAANSERNYRVGMRGIVSGQVFVKAVAGTAEVWWGPVSVVPKSTRETYDLD